MGKKSSPCIKMCQMDPGTRLCIGCGRTTAEIARWGRMSEFERLSVMAKLPVRLRQTYRREEEEEAAFATG